MNIDFTHNQIIRDTITSSFIESFSDGLVPYLVSEYGSSLDEIQFYEDHLTEGLRINGEFFYPLTVVVGGTPRTRFIKWQVSNYRNYDKFNPFSYKGREPLEFELVDEPSDELLSVCAGKRIYAAPGTALPVLLTSTSEEKTFLAGKYSQSFIDLLAQKLTALIEKEFSISGLSSSGVVLELRFEPGTFMEHVVASTTYRRLLIKARGCAPRDLWIKWTRLDGTGVYTFSDSVPESAIEFALAEDVPGKIREKEYRYLTATDTDKYQAAMSRKNITEWRDVMRRVIRRGEVYVVENDETKTVTPPECAPEDEIAYTSLVTEAATEASAVSDLDALLASLDIEDGEPEDTEEVDEELEALLQSAIGITAAEAVYAEEEAETVDAVEAEEHVTEPTEEAAPEIPEPVRVETIYSTPKIDEERIRYEIEARLRAEMEEKLKKKEQEAEELRARLAAKEKEDEREKLRLAEAARAALLQKDRLEAEAREREALERAEAEKRADEERRAAEEARLLAEREAEEARLLAEQEAKEKAEAEERAKREAEATVYVSRTVKLFFKQQIDPEITKRIHEIILATIKYYHKEDVYIKIKANIPDITTVHLEFVKIPEVEIPLLVNIIKVLGRSGLGITRAILD